MNGLGGNVKLGLVWDSRSSVVLFDVEGVEATLEIPLFVCERAYYIF